MTINITYFHKLFLNWYQIIWGIFHPTNWSQVKIKKIIVKNGFLYLPASASSAFRAPSCVFKEKKWKKKSHVVWYWSYFTWLNTFTQYYKQKRNFRITHSTLHFYSIYYVLRSNAIFLLLLLQQTLYSQF